MEEKQFKKRKIFIKLSEHRKIPMEMDVPNICPICCTSCYPLFQENTCFENELGLLISAFFLCPNCGQTFCITYQIKENLIKSLDFYPTFTRTSVRSIAPYEFLTKPFDFEDVVKISPRANETFIQSQKAEQLNLDEIAGMGYRKTLEILLKDYLIFCAPESKTVIQQCKLAQTIKKLEDENVKILAEKCSWVGNDETHYLKKHLDLDISNLKQLLNGVITYIHLKLLVKQTNKIQSK